MPKKKKTKNTNCLEGLRCSQCKSLEPFYIYATARFTVRGGGTE